MERRSPFPTNDSVLCLGGRVRRGQRWLFPTTGKCQHGLVRRLGRALGKPNTIKVVDTLLRVLQPPDHTTKKVRYNQWALTTEKDPVLRDFGNHCGNSSQRRLPEVVQVLRLLGDGGQRLLPQAGHVLRLLGDSGQRPLPQAGHVLRLLGDGGRRLLPQAGHVLRLLGVEGRGLLPKVGRVLGLGKCIIGVGLRRLSPRVGHVLCLLVVEGWGLLLDSGDVPRKI